MPTPRNPSKTDVERRCTRNAALATWDNPKLCEYVFPDKDSMTKSRPFAEWKLDDELEISLPDGTFFPTCEGLNVAVKGLLWGEVAVISFPAELGYASDDERVPPFARNVALEGRIELCSYDHAPPPKSLPEAERVSMTDAMRKRSNHWFERGDFERALRHYSAALEWARYARKHEYNRRRRSLSRLDLHSPPRNSTRRGRGAAATRLRGIVRRNRFDDYSDAPTGLTCFEDKKLDGDLRNAMKALLLNRAACRLKLKQWNEARADCDAVLARAVTKLHGAFKRLSGISRPKAHLRISGILFRGYPDPVIGYRTGSGRRRGQPARFVSTRRRGAGVGPPRRLPRDRRQGVRGGRRVEGRTFAARNF